MKITAHNVYFESRSELEDAMQAVKNIAIKERFYGVPLTHVFDPDHPRSYWVLPECGWWRRWRALLGL